MSHFVNKKRNSSLKNVPADAGKIGVKSQKIRNNAGINISNDLRQAIRKSLLNGMPKDIISQTLNVNITIVEKISMSVRVPSDDPKRVCLNANNYIGSKVLKESAERNEPVHKTLERIFYDAGRV